MTDTHEIDDLDLGYDLDITKAARRSSGTWVRGTLHGHRFDALVFAEHADDAEWELGDSRISKLWIQRIADKQTIFNWDRGANIAATDDLVQAIVDFLAGGLADYVDAR